MAGRRGSVRQPFRPYYGSGNGKERQIKAPEGSSIRLLGFVGGDLVYGLAEENSSVKVNGRTVQAPMYALEIVGKDMNLQTRYEKEGVYITDVEIEGSRVHLQRMTRVGDSYMTAGADTLVCNEEVEEDSMEGIGYLASEEQGRVYFVQTAESVSGGVDLNVPSKAVAEENNTVVLGQARAFWQASVLRLQRRQAERRI